jgi:hypothetical protein
MSGRRLGKETSPLRLLWLLWFLPWELRSVLPSCLSRPPDSRAAQTGLPSLNSGCSVPIATAKSNAFQLMGGGRRHPDTAWLNDRNQPQTQSCSTSWSRTPSSALSFETHPPRGRLLVTSNLENRDHIRPGHEDLKTLSYRLPVPSQLPSVLAKSPAGWPSSPSVPVTAKAGAPARWARCGSSNCRLHGNFSNQGASITSSTRSLSLIHISP